MKLLLALVCAFALAHAYPPDPPVSITRNTIFADEKFQGEVFENVDAFADIELYNEGINPYRLPTTTKPIHYDVFWDIDPNGRRYSGRVTIELVATQPGVSEITIHSNHTTLSNINLVKKEDGEPIAFTWRSDAPYDLLVIRPVRDLEYNAITSIVYILSISFEGRMRTDMYGIYDSWFRTNTSDPDSPVSWMATTQFQGTAARFAFPCYDEPSFKATFDIRIRRPITHKSWSCTRINRTNYDDDINPQYAVDEYLRTPVMSTYLLALIVADYESEPLIENGVLLYEVIGRKQAIDDGQGNYAFNVGQKLLANMSYHTDIDFFSISDNLKMTQAAIPDFSAGAMENWGLLTYREAYLLYDEGNTNSYYKQLIAYILSHEIAHMWFGNLVTCDWWDVLWLNEGFARYYQYFLTHGVETEMGFEIRFIIEQVHTALLADSANNPHPLSHSGIGSPSSVSSMFSTLSYNKGASIIRQTEHLLSYEVHRQGLREYLIDRSFNTSLPIDLFESLEDAAIQAGALVRYGPEFNFIEYYKSWTEQPGHPVLNVNVNHATGAMTITQRRFNINTGYSNIANNYIVPITFATATEPDFSDTKPTSFLTDTVTIIDRESVGDYWVIFNKQQTGFYRVNYDDYTWDLIAIALRGEDRTLIHEYNRAQIVNDVFQFARSGLMTYFRAFQILEFLKDETDYAPWVAAITGFNWIRNRLVSSPDELEKLNSQLAEWADNVMQELTYEPIDEESFMQSYLRYQLAPVMCAIGVDACKNAAIAQFQDLRNNSLSVPADSRNWVYCNALRQGSEVNFDFLWNRFLTENLYTEKILLLSALGCTPHESRLRIFLDAIVQENFIIRRQDYNTAFNAAVSGNEHNTQIAFQYIQENLALVTRAFGSPTTPLSYVSSRLRSPEEITAFRSWANENQETLGNYYTSVYNGAQSSEESIEWAESVASDLNNYFNSDVHITTSTGSTIITDPPTTLIPDSLLEPTTPELPDSAVSTFISTFLLSLGIIVHVFLSCLLL